MARSLPSVGVVETVAMQVRLLGPVDVLADNGGSRPVRGLRRTAVLATLALQHGAVVSVGQLVDVVWAGAAPPSALKTLQSHVSHLRQHLGDAAAIGTHPPGYVLDLGGDGTDVQQAERLLRQAQAPADAGRRVAILQAAAGLWRGAALADLAELPWLAEQATRLEVLQARVKGAWAEARLAAGEAATLVPDLEELVAGRPLDEQLRGQLMLALYRSGRATDALAAYHQLRRALDEELGMYPGPDLRRLETAILRQDPGLDAPARGPGAGPAPAARVPAQLPPAVRAFTGREAELESLDALLPEPPGAGAAAPVVIAAVSGTAGVGKTTLAVRWAHRVAARFPDGQLYVNLRGFDPGGLALEPSEAIRGFLEAFAVPVARIPADLDAQAGLYRSVLAGRRVLVVLDNARDVEQVRPLLPGSPGCAVIVTSRSHLTGLVAADGAYGLTLGLLPAADARDLLARRLGPERVTREPAAVDDIIAGCARLPLALAVAAAGAAASPGFPLAVFAAELRDATRALDPFEGGDPATDVRAVFSWSYQALTADAARLFRLLGLHPGPDIAIAAAASLAGIEPGPARARLAELTRAHLLDEHAPGRYAWHDLLRAYAAEQAHAHDSPQVRAAAVHRVLDHYLHTAKGAAMLMEPHYDALELSAPQPGTTVRELATAEAATAWFTAEHPGLLAAIRVAGPAGHGRHAWQLAWTLSAFFLRTGSWTDHALAQRAGRDAAAQLGDASGEAHARHALALGYARSGRFGPAFPLFLDALRRFEKIGDLVSQARIQDSLAWLSEREQRPADALRHARESFDLFSAAEHRPGQAMALNDIGYCQALLGHYDEAIACCERALAAIREVGEPHWEAATWDSLGYIHHQLGGYDQAIACYERSVSLWRDLADRFNEADTLDQLGNVHRSAGDLGAARRTWARALRIFREIDHPDGDQVRAKLDDAPAGPEPGPPGA
jgi:DNA-binding SARP family transcriptional activator/tetratricopeptide (TPR) repeat protein